MKRLLFISHLIICLATAAHAQYTTAGKIEYERKTNMWAQISEYSDDGDNEWIQNYKATNPQFKSSFFDLYFNNARCIYKPGREIEGTKWGWSDGPAKQNVVLTDLIAKQVKAAKLVYEQKFFVQDSMRKIDWKEKDEIRTIANYKCRKAVGRICDSVYVVAFYTEDIPASSGPEMFGGLPGMIMELAIPRLHTTWTATSVELTAPKETDFAISEKGKKVNEQQLYETIQSSLKDWGKWAGRNIWWSVL
jgi:GLPGLI family protein